MINHSLIFHRFAHTEFTPLTPTWDWNNRVPALDNGENIWAIYAAVEALQKVGKKDFQTLAGHWEGYLNYLKSTAAKVRLLYFLYPNRLQSYFSQIFYRGSGQICAVTSIKDQALPIDHPDQAYNCEGLNSFINDPYEGNAFISGSQLDHQLESTQDNPLCFSFTSSVISTKRKRQLC